MQGTQCQHFRIEVTNLIDIPGITKHHGADTGKLTEIVVLPPTLGKTGQISSNIWLKYHKEPIIFQ